ncbi:hypothetical protein BDB00DRAFT_396180 [Zychaea mexicana]|uniref:uncharacterized protein n=1 Tax=Zychaea mexicana TaxID=64656 RepID=UPI0022FE9F0B|nr:uncharacterized protein BDB00DRAFT_396180 [Zychaea mexicana]KAI9498662.1 hypothetical protein BDB00DRAFT_396180 [Zychaea mexicana]
MAHIILYDVELTTPNEIWSPNTCKTRYALNYKGIPYKTVWLKFPEIGEEIPKITKSKERPTVPVIVDVLHGNKVVQESWEIAKYLEEAYPDTPSLFHGNIGAHFFMHEYCTRRLLPKIFKLNVLTVMKKAGEHGAWFRQTREKIFKMPLEKFVGDESQHAKAITENLDALGRVLKTYPYLTGQQVGWADICLASYITFLRVMRPDQYDALVLNDSKAGKQFAEWLKRMDKYMQLAPPAPSARI